MAIKFSYAYCMHTASTIELNFMHLIVQCRGGSPLTASPEMLQTGSKYDFSVYESSRVKDCTYGHPCLC